MQNDMVVKDLGWFAGYARGDLGIWNLLIDHRITHRSYGQGIVTCVYDSDEGLVMEIVFHPDQYRRFRINGLFCNWVVVGLQISSDVVAMVDAIQGDGSTGLAHFVESSLQRQLREQREQAARQRSLNTQHADGSLKQKVQAARKQTLERKKADGRQWQEERAARQSSREEGIERRRREREEREWAQYQEDVANKLRSVSTLAIDDLYDLSSDEPHGPLIYHMTHVENLDNIVPEECLWCYSKQARRQLCRVDIGHRDIKQYRAAKRIGIGPGGVVGDYVPFYFTPRTPMLYYIHMRSGEGYRGGQDPIVFLVSSVRTACMSTRHWLFSDGNARSDATRFYNNLADLEHLDWGTIHAQSWNDREDGKENRQSEFLVYQSFAWSLIEEIGVSNRSMEQRVNEVLDSYNHPHRPAVNVQSEWYF